MENNKKDCIRIGFERLEIMTKMILQLNGLALQQIKYLNQIEPVHDDIMDEWYAEWNDYRDSFPDMPELTWLYLMMEHYGELIS